MAGYKNWIRTKEVGGEPTLFMDFYEAKLVNFYEAATEAVETLKNHYKNLHLCLSGGTDSEFIANLLLSTGVDFTPVLVDYKTNRTELWYAYRWCKTNGITPTVVDLSMQTAGDLFSYYSTKYSTSPINALEFVLDGLLPYASILTGSTDPFEADPVQDDTLSSPMPEEFSLYSYDFSLSEAFGDKHPGAFFTYTPTLFYSMIQSAEYNLPTAMEKAKLYGIPSRPKINASSNLKGLPRMDSLNLPQLYTYRLGNKDRVEKAVQIGETLQCTTIKE